MDRFFQEEYARRPVEVKHTHGFDIHLDPTDMGISPSIALLGWYELRTTELLIKLVRRGHRVVDVGANVGFFTLLAATIAGPEGVVVSFEPEPVSFSLLSKSVEKNGLGNIRLLQQCVSDVDGTRTLHLSVTPHKGLHSIERKLGGKKIEIASTRLDTVAKRLRMERIDLLKIDAEGSEPQVLAGARDLLERSAIGNIIMEWDPETWIGHENLLKCMIEKYDTYQVARSLPFVPPRRIVESSVPKSMPRTRFGVNLYMRQKS